MMLDEQFVYKVLSETYLTDVLGPVVGSALLQTAEPTCTSWELNSGSLEE